MTKSALKRRGVDFGVDDILKKDEMRRKILGDVEAKKARRNEVSKKIPELKKSGQDTEPVFAEMKALGDEIKAADDQLRTLEDEIKNILLSIPNVPSESTPDGTSDADNVEIRKFMDPTSFEFEPKPHWELGRGPGYTRL